MLSIIRKARSMGVILALLPLASLGAQEISDKITPGTRVRVSAPAVAKNRIVGTVVSVDSTRIVLQATPSTDHQPPPLTVPWAAMQRLELSQGRKWSGGRTAAGAGIGLLAGALVGAGIGAVAPSPSFDEDDGQAVSALVGGIVGAGSGLVLGAIIGALPHERWQMVPLAKVRLGILLYRPDGKAPSSVGLVWSVAFP